MGQTSWEMFLEARRTCLSMGVEKDHKMVSVVSALDQMAECDAVQFERSGEMLLQDQVDACDESGSLSL